MKKRTSKTWQKALACLGLAVLVFSYTTPAFAAVETTEESILSGSSDEASVPSVSKESSSETAATTESEETSTTTTSSDTETDSSSSYEESTTSTSTAENSTSESTSQESTTTETTTDSTSSGSAATSSSDNSKTGTSSSYQEASSQQQKEAASSVTQSAEKTTPELQASLKADSLTASNLNGFELPQLSTIKTKQTAAIIAEALKQLDKEYQPAEREAPAFDNLGLINTIYQQLFDTTLVDSYKDINDLGQRVDLKAVEAGNLLVWLSKDQTIEKIALYLGQDRYVILENPTKEMTEPPKVEIARLFLDTEYAPDYAIAVDQPLQLNSYGQTLLDTYAANITIQTNAQTEAFIHEIGSTAQELGETYDIYASVMIAQAILESGSGSSQLASAPYYNLFGIKGPGVSFSTNEDNGAGELFQISASFRSYTDYKGSLEDYVRLIRGGISSNDTFYQGAWRSKAANYLQATAFLTGKYATDTQYNNKLNSIIAAYNLTRFDEPKGTVGEVLATYDAIPSAYRDSMSLPKYNGVNYNSSGSYAYGQCTWYVFNRAASIGKRFDNFMGNGQDWGVQGAALGYEVKDTPSVGTAISFKAGVAGSDAQYGHVAFVEAVLDAGILISEANVIDSGTGKVSYRVISNDIALSNGVTYIVPK